VPTLLRTQPPGDPVNDAPDYVVKPKPSAAYPATPALDAVKWEFRGGGRSTSG
jgi:hypothetical protein